MVQNTSLQQHPYQQQTKLRSDRLLTYFMISYFVFGLVLATFYDTWLIAMGVGSLCLLAYFGTKSLLPRHSLYQYVGSTVLAVFMAQFIYQMHGLFEMHFFAFVASAILITYQEWRLQLPLVLLVVGHHVVFAYLQYVGVSDVYFTQATYMDLQTLIFHLFVASVIFFICGLWSYHMKKITLQMVADSSVLEQQLKNVNVNVAFAEEITQNNLQAPYDLAEGDILGKSLLDMRSSLVKAAEREKQEKFINLGMAQMGDVLRNHTGDVNELAYKITQALVQYLGANQGGLFLLEGNEEEDPHLALAGCYAYERRKHQQKRVEIGEGLVGQAFLEKDTLFLTDIPETYFHITSGLGQASPRCLLLAVIQSNENAVGVLEIASFRVLEEYEIGFVNKVAEIIASSILSVRTTEKTSRLLEEAESLTQQMQAQEEEMRQNLEELAATQEEMRRRESDTQQLLTSVQQREAQLRDLVEYSGDVMYSIDTDYRLLAFNEACRTAFSRIDITIEQERNVLHLLHAPELRTLHQSYYDRALAGESFSVITSQPHSYDARQVISTYSPIGTQGHITGVSVQIRDLQATAEIQPATLSTAPRT